MPQSDEEHEDGEVEDSTLPEATDACDHPDAPIRIGANMRGAIPKIHFLGVSGRAIACRWHPIAYRIRWIDNEESWNKVRPDIKQLCHRCSEHFRMPATWQPLTVDSVVLSDPEEGLGTSDSSSSSDSSSDSDAVSLSTAQV